MVLENIKVSKLYNFINSFLILLGITFIFTKVNVLGIFTVGVIVNTFILILFNYRYIKEIILEDFKRISLFLIYPVFLYIMNIVHGDDKLFLFEIWAVLLILPFVTICVRQLYKIKLDYLLYAFVLSGLILMMRLIIYLLFNSHQDRFQNVTPYNTIHSGLLVAMYCAMSIYLFIEFLNLKKYGQSLLFIILFIVSLLSLLAVASKGPILAFLLIFLFIIIFKLGIKKSFIFLAILSAFFVVIYFSLGNVISNKIDLSRFNQVVNIEQQYKSKADTSTGIRLQLYKVGVRSFIESPITGLSYADISKLENKMIKKGEIEPFVKTYFHFHNDLLNSLGHYGILGGIGIIVFWVMLFKFYPRISCLGEKNNIHIRYIMFIIFGMFILSSFTDAYIFGSTRPTMILLFVCSIIYSIKFDTKNKDCEE